MSHLASEESDAARKIVLDVPDFTDEREDAPVIGIDLGTSTSAISLLIEGRPELIPDDRGDCIIPSVVQSAPGGEYVVGSSAKHSAITFHDRTVQEVKRLMGTGERVKLGKAELLPEEVAAIILRHLKGAAEARLGQSVRDVVLSVPARFENEAREATKRAARMAGLHVIRLINEPTAAALSYGLERLEDRQKVLVFDFGGGTLDVTILEMYDGVLDIKTSVGDDKLGGKDVDDIIVNLFRDAYKAQYDKKLPTASRDRKLAQTLKEEAEEAKKRLTAEASIQIDLPFLTSEGGISFTLTRQQLEDEMEGMLMRAMVVVNEALSRARLHWSDIDVVLPVGGSSRLGLFRRALEMSWGRKISDYENPDEAVAKGAAIACGIERSKFDEAKSIMILDVSPHRLGVATIKQVGVGQFVEDYFSEIIPKDSKLPAIEQRDYETDFGGVAEAIAIRIYEATTDSNLCRDHRMVSEMPLRSLNGKGASEPVKVEFRYTLDGTLNVSAHYLSMPVVKVGGRFTLSGGMGGDTASDGNGSGGEGAGGAMGILSLTQEQVAQLWRESPYAEQCAPLIEQAESAQKEHPESAATLRHGCDTLKIALVSDASEADVRRKLDALTDLLFDLA